MILHHFCRRSSKIKLFWQKQYYLTKISENTERNFRKYVKNTGFPRVPCGLLIIPSMVCLTFSPGGRFLQNLLRSGNDLQFFCPSSDCGFVVSCCRHAITICGCQILFCLLQRLHRAPQGSTRLHRATGNPRKPRNFWYFWRLLGYFLDFLSSIRVFGQNNVFFELLRQKPCRII